MDGFYSELACLINQIRLRKIDNPKYNFRIIDFKQNINEGEELSDEDIPLILKILDDTMKLNFLIEDNFDSFEKFMHMYTTPCNTEK